ncbi:MAG: deoxyribonuclease IV [Planctomycetia bacterium]|nr:deoxyribonuclease IV [Planctomycetia bacterium]MCC7316690.1 deoxyribonuclease IV [Planctomycetota bacterium]OQZ06478.1 MAG: hypothetical protein B6D36_04790 [Planctomycetes bacterium UTPLA1]
MKPSKVAQKFGAHLSVAGGLHLAFDEAEQIGCDCLQIFVKNQRQWVARPITDEQARLFKDAQRKSGVSPVVAHASYLLNLASPEKANRDKSRDALIDELHRCEALGIEDLIIHPGAHMGSGIEAGIAAIADSLDQVHAATAGFTCRVLLESTAGQGTTIGHEICQLGEIIKQVRQSERLGVCIDTCHVFAAGYDIRDRDDYERLLDEIKRHVDIDRVKCIHTNDSKGDCGSRLDRHEHITKGKIGKSGFANILNDPRLAHVPRILETPKGTDGRGVNLDRVNINRMKKLIRP